MLTSFLIFLLLFALVGLSSMVKSRGTKRDYYLASGAVKPWLVGLSAVATNNSGYMFIGVIGYTYVTGLASIWLMVGWILGDFLASLFIHRKLNLATQKSQELSYAGVLANWSGEHHFWVKKLVALISVLFLLVYASAQLMAGSKALFVLFEWPQWAGAILGAVVVALYCYSGGIRASIWTDAAQSIVMIVAMGILLISATSSLGGVREAVVEMQKIDDFMDWFPDALAFPGILGAVAFAVSWAFAGFSVVGQPHVMVRFMALESSSQMLSAKVWYYLWFTAFYCMATCVGLLSRVFIPESASFDAELALPTMALQLLPATLVGLILAGIFAATISTADSLILSCSSAISHDLSPQKIESTRNVKLITLAVVGAAVLISLFNRESVFSLVIFAWSGLASAFAPLLICLCLGGRPKQWVSIVAIILGLTSAITWRIFDLHGFVYEGVPGMAIGMLILLLGWRRRSS